MKKLFSEIPVISSERITLKKITAEDSPYLLELAENHNVYRYLPTFLFEQKYTDINKVISLLYDECLEESLILGIFSAAGFCGIAEFYGYKEKVFLRDPAGLCNLRLNRLL